MAKKKRARSFAYTSPQRKASDTKNNKMRNIKYAVLFVAILSIIVSVFFMIKFVSAEIENAAEAKNEGIAQYGGNVYTIDINVKNHGTMRIELYEELAPLTVKNIVKYVKDGFYDGLTFHRIIDGFMIQGGDPEGTGSGGQDLPKIKGEFADNGWDKNLVLPFKKGVIGLARGTANDSGSSQFFICLDDYEYGNGKYASFGKLVRGNSVLEKLGKTAVGQDGETPLNKPVINSVKLVKSGDPYISNHSEYLYLFVIPFAALAVLSCAGYIFASKKIKAAEEEKKSQVKSKK